MTKRQRKAELRKERYKKVLNLIESITSTPACAIPEQYIDDLLGLGLISYNGTVYNWEINTLVQQLISDLMFIDRCVVSQSKIDSFIINKVTL